MTSRCLRPMGPRRTTGWGSSGGSLPEKVFDLFREWIGEVIPDGELAFRGGKLKLSVFLLRRRRHGHEFRDRFAFVRDDDLFSNRDAIEQVRKMILRVFNRHLHLVINEATRLYLHSKVTLVVQRLHP